jgi:hypothetical protein
MFKASNKMADTEHTTTTPTKKKKKKTGQPAEYLPMGEVTNNGGCPKHSRKAPKKSL